MSSSIVRQGKRKSVLPVGVVFMAALLTGVFACSSFGIGTGSAGISDSLYLRVYNWKTGELYVSRPAKVGSELFFGWIHSLEKIPWNEYYHVGEDLRLILDAITFPAFGAGIPENKGRVCYVKDGLIHMEEIGQPFDELLWLNSHTATQEIRLDGEVVARGSELPQHTRLRLIIEKGDENGP
jgi:hypothetical protein